MRSWQLRESLRVLWEREVFPPLQEGNFLDLLGSRRPGGLNEELEIHSVMWSLFTWPLLNWAGSCIGLSKYQLLFVTFLVFIFRFLIQYKIIFSFLYTFTIFRFMCVFTSNTIYNGWPSRIVAMILGTWVPSIISSYTSIFWECFTFIVLSFSDCRCQHINISLSICPWLIFFFSFFHYMYVSWEIDR